MTMGSPKRLFAAGALAAALAMTTVPAVAAPAAGAATTAARATATVQKVAVTGQVTNPASYTAADLAALGQKSYPVTNPLPGAPRSVTGTSLEDVITKAGPKLPEGKHTDLRALATVTGRLGRTTVALGELEAKFGNHPAVLVPQHDGTVNLVIPGDNSPLRTVVGVRAVTVAVNTDGAIPMPEGFVQIGNTTLPLSLINRLPSQTVTVNFQTDKGPQTHTEKGVPLWLVTLAAGRLPLPATSAVAVGDDGYGTAVTFGENYFGGRPLLLSTVEDGTPLMRPRLIPYGDLAGGRYNSYVVRVSLS